MRLSFLTFCAVVVIFGLSACQLLSSDKLQPSNGTKVAKTLSFVEVGKPIVDFEDRKRRKWDNPVIVDLDQDGWQDLITTDHGSAINIYWNNQGQFSGAQTILKRDTHGVTAADYDQDGLVEIMVVQGGGNGKNPKFPLLFEVNKSRKVTRTEPFKHFEFTRGRAAKFVDVDNDGTLEFIQTGFPLKSQLQGANFLYRLDQFGVYQASNFLPQGKWLGYKTTLTDINNDGDQDILFYGGANIIAVMGQKNGAETPFVERSPEVLGQLSDTDNVSSVTPMDFDNDGDMDLFLTRSNHQFKRHSFYDKASQRFAFFTFKERYQFDDMEINGDFILTNLQQAHPDFDFFIGSKKTQVAFDVDLHGHKDLVFSQDSAAGWPNDTTAKGVYVGYLGNNKWRLLVNTRSRTAGVIENVMNDMSTPNLVDMPAKLLENRGGKFFDVSSQFGLNISEQTKSAVAADFNNDGWLDLFVVRYGSMATENRQLLYLNDNGKSFKLAQEVSIVSREIGATGSGAEAFDFDQDGDMDLVYANERGLWHLFENRLISTDEVANSLTIAIGRSPKTLGSYLAAKVEVEACGLTMTRYVGASSAPFSQNGDQQIHIGLGDCKLGGEYAVTWSNGESEAANFTASQSKASVGR